MATISEELREIAEWLKLLNQIDSITFTGGFPAQADRLLAIAERLEGRVAVRPDVWCTFDQKFRAKIRVVDAEDNDGTGDAPAEAVAALQAELDDPNEVQE